MYKLYQYKPIEIGFVILCSNNNVGQLKLTINSIKAYYPDNEITIIISNTCEEYPKAIRGGSTFESMINKGLKESKCNEWNLITVAGGWIKSRIDIKYSYFIESTKDILFPILKTKSIHCNFMNNNNGMMIHKKAFADIGEFLDDDDSKLFWATTAIEKGYRFKGIVGGRLF